MLSISRMSENMFVDSSNKNLRKACDLEARHREDCISLTLAVVIIHSLIMSIRNVFETVHYYSGDGTKDGETMKQL